MAYMMDDIDQRLVKRGKFGPLDIYPQEDKQKEVTFIAFRSFCQNIIKLHIKLY